MFSQSVKKERNSNLELFRIILMLAIIAHHYVVNSGLMLDVSKTFCGNSIFLVLFGAWGKTGINCFLLITGYFMCTSQITLKKFLKLLLEVEFYHFLFSFIFLFSGYEPFHLTAFLKSLLPITNVADGFVSCFLLFFLCIPFLNILIRNMDHRRHLLLLLLLLFIYTVLPSLKFPISMNYVTWFSVVYLLASYIRLYPVSLFSNTRFWGVISILAIFLSAGSILFLYRVLGRNIFFFMADSNKILAVMTSVSLFLFFKNLKIKQSKLINTAASSVFGVLLIHANSDAMRRWLWTDVLQNRAMFDSKYLFLHSIGAVITIFIVCVLIDQCRIRLIEIPLFRLLENNWKWIENLQKKNGRTNF